MAACAAAIKGEGLVDSDARGPVLFREERISRGRVIELLKFRTLTATALAALGPGPTHIKGLEREGRLTRVWKSDDLGLDVNCDMTRDEQMVLGTKPFARQQWVNRRAMVDDIVSTPSGPAVIIRRVAGGRTKWQIAILGEGATSRHELPVTSSSPWAHLAAESRGNSLVLLVADRIPDAPEGAPPRLIHLQWSAP